MPMRLPEKIKVNIGTTHYQDQDQRQSQEMHTTTTSSALDTNQLQEIQRLKMFLFV
jgi:hypothetical protein